MAGNVKARAVFDDRISLRFIRERLRLARRSRNSRWRWPDSADLASTARGTRPSGYILGPFGPDSDLKRQVLMLAERVGGRSKRKAVVAIDRNSRC